MRDYDLGEGRVLDFVGSLVEVTSKIVNFFGDDRLAFEFEPLGVSVIGGADGITHLLNRSLSIPGAAGLGEGGRSVFIARAFHDRDKTPAIDSLWSGQAA